MPAYNGLFPKGTRVRVANRAALEDFQARWHWHHPVTPEHLACAGRVGAVTSIGYYHGGDPLYQVEGIPGIWHEGCLAADPAPAV
jgi:hypothetical protein